MKSISKKQGLLWLALGICIGAAAWNYDHRIAECWRTAIGREPGALKAQKWDLYPRWVGARELFLNGRNPYSPEVSHEIQMAFYGHIVTPEESQRRIVDEQRFAYPIYVVFLMAPTIRLDFATVQYWAPYVLGAITALGVVFCIGLLDWKLPWTAQLALISFVLSSPQIAQGMRHEQLALLVGCLLTAAAWCVHKHCLVSAGVLLAVATIKPQMTLLPLLWFFIWAAGEWRQRSRLLMSFGVMLILLIGAGEVLVPGWLSDFVAAMQAYRRYFPTTSVLRMLLGDWLGFAAALLIVGWLLVFAWNRRGCAEDSRQFAWVFAVFLAVTVITFPLFTPFNQVLLILPVLLVVQEWLNFPKASRFAFFAILCWPFVSYIVLLSVKAPITAENALPLIPAFGGSILPLLLPVVLFTKRKNPGTQIDIAKAG